MQWLQVTVTTTSEASDTVSVILSDFGSDGVCVSDKRDVEEVLNDKRAWDYADDNLLNLTGDAAYVSGFFQEDFDLRALKSALEKFRENSEISVGSLEIETQTVKNADWENEWRKYYRPIERENVAVVPEWLDYDGSCPVRVYIEPGMAFGTGRHETTAMCISLLQLIDVKDKTVLDMGCGSGILGVSALKLGAKRCVMSDIDAAAIASARENARLNGVYEQAEFVCGNLELSDSRYGIVLANLTADILLRLYDVLPPVTEAGGYIVISGLIHARADETLKKYESDFELVKRLSEGEWQAMLLKKR